MITIMTIIMMIMMAMMMIMIITAQLTDSSRLSSFQTETIFSF